MPDPGSKNRGQKCLWGEHIVEKKVKKETLEGYYNPFFTLPAFVGYFLYIKHGDTGLSCGNNTINKTDEVPGLRTL